MNSKYLLGLLPVIAVLFSVTLLDSVQVADASVGDTSPFEGVLPHTGVNTSYHPDYNKIFENQLSPKSFGFNSVVCGLHLCADIPFGASVDANTSSEEFFDGKYFIRGIFL